MVRYRKGKALEAWIRVASASDDPDMRRFAQSLQDDFSAVQAALTEPWSQGRVEGFNNKLKTIKRCMFGRGGFPPLKSRMLHR